MPIQLQAIANHVWQSTLFAAAVGLVVVVCRRFGPRARYGLWLAASAKFLIPFSILSTAGRWFGQRAAVSIAPPFSFASGITASSLKRRIEAIMTGHAAPRLTLARKAVLAAAGCVALASPFVAGLVAQTTPTRNAALRAVWTPASGAAKNLLTALEGRHHDAFIDRARAGNIDLVFFGTTDTEMWLWPDTILGGVNRGKRVWDQAFGSLKAANFGSQGTHFESLLWRMQNGELDGYEAKLVVLHGVGITSRGGQLIGNIGDQLIGDRQAEFVAGYARLIAEIRARQPQAKILIVPPFPRGRLRREEWRTVADANAVAYTRLTDGSAVFYANFGDRFFLPDGSHNQEMWTIPGPPNAGIHEPGFKAWAEELQPWLDRFVR